MNMNDLLLVIISLMVLEDKSVSSQCTDGFVKHGDSCYHFSHDTETWLDAQVACEKIYGAKLVEIENENENNFLLNEVNTLGARYWIGGNDLQVEGEWKWYSSNDVITYSTWCPGNPSNSRGDENCMELVDCDAKGPLTPHWNDLQCHSFQKYICEKPVNEGQIVARYWIGGNDLQVEGEWKWYSSNDVITYSTWCPGNPSNSRGDENCMELVDCDAKGPLTPHWNDLQCHSFQKYICEKPVNEGQIVG